MTIIYPTLLQSANSDKYNKLFESAKSAKSAKSIKVDTYNHIHHR